MRQGRASLTLFGTLILFGTLTNSHPLLTNFILFRTVTLFGTGILFGTGMYRGIYPFQARAFFLLWLSFHPVKPPRSPIFDESSPPRSTNHPPPAPPIPGPFYFIFLTSFWPCLRHGSLASSLPLPSAQASACWGRCPQTPVHFQMQSHPLTHFYAVHPLTQFYIVPFSHPILLSPIPSLTFTQSHPLTHFYAVSPHSVLLSLILTVSFPHSILCILIPLLSFTQSYFLT